MNSKPTLLMVPCFAGAPWNLDQLAQLKGWPMRTMRLPEELNDLENLADFALAQARDLDSYVLVGDSFGAVISIAAAVRGRPPDRQEGRRYPLGGIRQSREVVLPRTGHMFRFSHPDRYSEAVNTFLESAIPTVGSAR